MKINKISLLALMLLVLSLVVVGCTPADNTNDTGMNRNNRLTTQTRIGDRMDGTNGTDRFNTGLNDGFDTGLNNGFDNNNLGNNNLNNNNLNNGMTRSNQTGTNFGNMATRANEVATKIADLPEVDKASVVITEDTALVGCSLRGNTQGTMTNALRQKIRGIVKDTVNVDNVSITTDPNMTGRIRTMSNSILQGNPIEGFAEEIRTLIRDITPNTNNNMMR
ncbi:MAG: YhcN/YlaJ family sporulation lipoprotein [Tissierellaceae bacterium]|nr:YhcN/YlaJ family sporulation lipoprotein [Tissierellaceae bacterium]